MKAKKEKNRCEDQTEHSTLLPSNNSAKSLNNSLSSLNGAGGANASLMAGANLGMLGGQHLLNDELIGLMENEDSKNQLKMPGLHGVSIFLIKKNLLSNKLQFNHFMIKITVFRE